MSNDSSALKASRSMLDEPTGLETNNDDSKSTSPFANSSGTSTPSAPISPLLTPSSTPSSTPSLALTLAPYNLTSHDLSEIHALLTAIALDAGKILLEAEHDFLVSATTKNNTSDLVTKYDGEVEELVKQRLHVAYPDIPFFGEESFKPGTRLPASPTFICDPIDGTLNFTKQVPNCAISLALAVARKPVVGIVYNPFRADLYSALKNNGAYLTNLSTGSSVKLPLYPIPPPLNGLADCLVAVEWGNQRSGPNWALRTSVHTALLTAHSEGGAMCKSVRSNGSAALDFCYVAQGMLDAYWEAGVWVWDVAAGWIILEEAGGLVASANPGDWGPTLEGRVYFAVRGAKREEQVRVVEEVWGIMGDRRFVYP
ncbi:hypothetical protein IAQ61_006345 [Plenodomus lingam]|uniref:Inositol-1-monophosphatase n=1 Tax=Leptosphaeria maculans (strain JN3 / isolate v23.1.3 / race Av1-4-5-6-7-8) TaxID=985895 RepID=E4ZSB1_LEPMJ|nr:hypothetical protein LEMA_P122700.1 [Plenodomus lingam JN3]KAH9869140.1 hypothetical protein IAQ61_006345 [Plenodomus lingam]CBX94291.1 hypothetical protein LEMA_P122700.1 [Plenodomus lingam JN3]